MSNHTPHHQPFVALSASASRPGDGWSQDDSAFGGLPPAPPRPPAARPYLWLGVLAISAAVVLGAVAAVVILGGGPSAWFSAEQPAAPTPPDSRPDASAATGTGDRRPDFTGDEKPGGDPKPPEGARRVQLAPNLLFEVEGDKRRVVVQSAVCLRQGEYQLEGLLTRKRTKEHEYILSADVDGEAIHAALIAARAEPGSPVRFQPRYQPATGSVVKIYLRYEKDGRTVTVPAQQWIRNLKTKKDLEQDWVFAGSHRVPDPDDPKKHYYLANQGDYVCVCNQDSAMLDLPVQSPRNPDDRLFEAHTERIPPIGTKVEVLFEPVVKR